MYGSRVPVSAMVQVSDSVGSTMKGSINALLGSGMASMSEASMLFQPRIEEPSKPRPSLKISSVSSRMGQLKCCQVPKVSTNLISIILAPLFFANSITLLGVLISVSFVWFLVLFGYGSVRRAAPAPALLALQGTSAALRKRLQL